MEIEELKAIWQQYDSKLDNLERLNKKLIMETLSKKPQKKLNWMKYRSAYSMFIVPFALAVSLSPNFRVDNVDLKFLIGCMLTLASVVYLTWINLKNYNVEQKDKFYYYFKMQITSHNTAGFNLLQ